VDGSINHGSHTTCEMRSDGGDLKFPGNHGDSGPGAGLARWPGQGRRAEHCAATRRLAVKWLSGRRQWRSHGRAAYVQVQCPEGAVAIRSRVVSRPFRGPRIPEPGAMRLPVPRLPVCLGPCYRHAHEPAAAAPRRLDAPLLAAGWPLEPHGHDPMTGRRSRDAGRGMCLPR
jgi:hypothetical protein